MHRPHALDAFCSGPLFLLCTKQCGANKDPDTLKQEVSTVAVITARATDGMPLALSPARTDGDVYGQRTVTGTRR
ncbi:hypothetical protein MATL_G00201390 [Megalops atlanticus]|uniref:Uncharacterized protein n=1 Tax=Megalops atlanticus TaxID=7932 RepID=A0A9D3PJP1_MEGAT|nr:hypothetical protein MATL_G00201390 [Megalops atlanticus]